MMNSKYQWGIKRKGRGISISRKDEARDSAEREWKERNDRLKSIKTRREEIKEHKIKPLGRIN